LNYDLLQLMFVLRDTHDFICYWKWSLFFSLSNLILVFCSFFLMRQIYPLSLNALEFSLDLCTKKQNCFK
jgi:hypothetical protein